ncbi:MAG: TatD family hydrolase [Dehalococcoidia bacterium]
MTGIIDTHAHLQLSQFDSDREAVLRRAWEAGLEAVMVPGVDLASSERAVVMAEADPRLYAAVGCHPHDARRANDRVLADLADLARHPRVVAVGEIGLDFYRNLSPREAQLRVLRYQLATASEAGLPVVIHCREAQREMLPIIEEWSRSLGATLPGGRPLGVMHYFSGDLALALRYAELGFLVSVHDSVTYPESERVRKVAAKLPLEHLVVETDSPYGAPRSRRGQRNEPAYLAEAVAVIAELRGTRYEDVALHTRENAVRLFGLARPERAAAPPASRVGARRGAP